MLKRVRRADCLGFELAPARDALTLTWESTTTRLSDRYSSTRSAMVKLPACSCRSRVHSALGQTPLARRAFCPTGSLGPGQASSPGAEQLFGGAKSGAKMQATKKGLGCESPNPLFCLVGTGGFEPPTPCTPCKCATRLRYAPRVVACSAERALRRSGGNHNGFMTRMEPEKPPPGVGWVGIGQPPLRPSARPALPPAPPSFAGSADGSEWRFRSWRRRRAADGHRRW